MAQSQIEDEVKEETTISPNKNTSNTTKKIVDHNNYHSTNKKFNNNSNVPSKLNAQAPEFVPRSQSSTFSAGTTNAGTQMPVSSYYYPCFHFLGPTALSDWFYNSTAPFMISNPNLTVPFCSSSNAGININSSSNVLTDELRQKIIKQVEYQFSDMSLLANESMSKHTSKDPAGYVPISFIASTKKMRALVNDHNLLSQVLKSSSKLVVSEDGKKVRRKVPFTDRDKEELQTRTVLVENLPEDHSHQNIEKIFHVVGSVKTIRICHPQESNSSHLRSDFAISNKLHALVEFEAQEMAEKAVEQLNDERNWRKGLRVRLLHRCSPKSVLKGRKPDFNGILDEEETPLPETSEESSRRSNEEIALDSNEEEHSGVSKNGSTRGRGRGRGSGQRHGGRGQVAPSPQSASTPQCEVPAKQPTKGPRMPDGAKGFGIGRGKPIAA